MVPPAMSAGGAARRGVLVVAVMAAIALFPADAGAVSASVYVDPYCCNFPPTLTVGSSPGENTRLVVQANGGDPGSVGAAELVVTSEGKPISAGAYCTSAGPQVAVCTLGGTPITGAIFELYGGSNKVAFAPGSALIYQVYRTGGGADVISTGPLAGSPTHSWNTLSSFLGAGNDRIEFGPRPATGREFVVRLEDGNDTAIDLDSVAGVVDCGAGTDRLVSDGPNETYDCERQVQP